MHLQSGSRNIRRDRAEAGLVNNIRLFRAVRDQDNLFRLHNCADTHGDRRLRNVIDRFKEAGVCLNRGIGELHFMSDFIERIGSAR